MIILKAGTGSIWSLYDNDGSQRDLEVLHEMFGIALRIYDQLMEVSCRRQGLVTHAVDLPPLQNAGCPDDISHIALASWVGEVAILASLTAHELAYVSAGLGVLRDLVELRRNHLPFFQRVHAEDPSSLLRWELYERLIVPIEFVGPQMMQKSLRGIVRTHATPSPVLLAAWRLQYSRFFSLLARVTDRSGNNEGVTMHGRYNVEGLTDVSITMHPRVLLPLSCWPFLPR
jgi:hypothetical protein